MWRIYGEDKPSHFGILTFDPESGLELNIKIPQSRKSYESDLLFFQQQDQGDPKVAKIIKGEDRNNNPVVLLECYVKHWQLGARLDHYRISVELAMLDYHEASWERAQFRAATVHYTHLTDWMSQLLLKQYPAGKKPTKNSASWTYEVEPPHVMTFELSNDVQVHIQRSCLPDSSTNEFHIRLSHTICFAFSELLPAKAIYKGYVFVFLRLLSLLSGARIWVDEFDLYSRDPFEPGHTEPWHKCEVLFRNTGISASTTLHYSQMVVNYNDIEAEFGNILKLWFEHQARLEPVIELFFVVMYNEVLTEESRFLLLAQALEVYHARCSKFSSVQEPQEIHERRVKDIMKSVSSEKDRSWLKIKLHSANQKTLSRRIEDILKSEFCKHEAGHLTAKIKDFSKKVRDSRNYYTHYGNSLRERGSVATGLELRRITFALFDLLHICLMKELGIKGAPIEGILARNSSTKWGDMDDVKSP